ncbi:MAG: LacI family DNA-binding transcriptional regulator [Lentisphaeria bacterium]|nr:LacI family DNA-binding transcriptional regulator [Lentisphaeria bacterium]
MGITIRQIAELAGVSTATVSRVINDSGFVKDETRRLITGIMKERNYTPQLPQKRPGPKFCEPVPLKHRTFSILWGHEKNVPQITTAQEIMIGISEALNEFGASLKLDVLEPGGESSETLQTRKVDGIFLNGNFSAAFLDRVRAFPVVWLLQAGSHDFGDRVQPDHLKAGLLAYDYLRSRNCRNLCCVSCSSLSRTPKYWKSREDAFCNAAAADKVECRAIRLDYDDNIGNPMPEQAAAACSAIERILQLPERPDGIFVANTLGGPIYSELVRNGIVPGRDIELIAGDKRVCNGYFNPEPVLLDIAPRMQGRLAVQAMLLRLANPAMPQLTYMQMPTLVVPEK